jgi:hypothetical protein
VDISNIVRSDTLRPVATVVVPGAVAMAPWGGLVLHTSPLILAFCLTHEATAVLALTLLALCTGMVIESFATTIESDVIDRFRKDRKEVEDVWFMFLQIVHVNEPIGRGFLRSVLLRFKFELNFGIAMLLSCAGTITWHCVGPFLSDRLTTSICVVELVLAGYLFFEARRSSTLLHRLRKDMLAGVRWARNIGDARSSAPE